MIFFSHSSRIRILQLTFALVCSCSEGLLTTEKHHLVPFSLLIFCILCLSIQIKYFFFLDTQGTFELKSVFRLLSLFYRQDRSSLPVSYEVLYTGRLRSEVQPLTHAMKYHSDRKGTPFVYLLLTKYGTTPFTYLVQNFVSLFNC